MKPVYEYRNEKYWTSGYVYNFSTNISVGNMTGRPIIITETGSTDSKWIN